MATPGVTLPYPDLVPDTDADADQVQANFEALRDKFGEIVDGDLAADGDFDANKLSITAGKRITETRMESLAVSTRVLQDDAVDGSKLADNSVGLVHMTDGSVGTAELIDGSVTAPKIPAATVTLTRLKTATALITFGGGFVLMTSGETRWMDLTLAVPIADVTNSNTAIGAFTFGTPFMANWRAAAAPTHDFDLKFARNTTNGRWYLGIQNNGPGSVSPGGLVAELWFVLNA